MRWYNFCNKIDIATIRMKQKKIVVISGGCGDVGRTAGKKLSEDGFDIILLYRDTPPEEARTILGSFAPGHHEAVPCDIRDENSLGKVFGKVQNEGGQILACIHAAVNPIIRKDFFETTGAELEGQFGAGFFGGFRFFREAALAMKENGGALIGILSRAIQGKTPHPRMAGYVMAKHALRGLLRELHLELASSAPMITVNAVSPDFLDTNLNRDLPGEVRKFIIERAPRTSIRTPEDVAAVLSFLCSKQGKAVNGKIFSLDPREVEDL